ncbi:acyl-CoA synthetase family protein [Streptomyces geranii]|uniref:AMP-binding protein n=1 Tax=Streptomyces geranii TaxID=2058923 RepID=UPI000D0367AD|nr:AMP-binding protein [Streptomyces geranii]
MVDDIDRVLDTPIGDRPDPDEFVRAAMRWHFGPGTGSPFWLARARTLDFDPLTDVKVVDDLALFPNVCDELRDVRAEDLVPRGYGEHPDVCGFFESGGTTGRPKRVVVLRDWFLRSQEWISTNLDAHGVPRGVNWLTLLPSGPHMAGYAYPRLARDRGGHGFSIDMDPRWARRLVSAGRAEDARDYSGHLLEQARDLLRSQDVGLLAITPPLLERLAADDELTDLVRAKVKAVIWVGTHMDADTRDLLGGEVFPGVRLIGCFGSTMMMHSCAQRVTEDAGEVVFDPPSPYITFRVVDPDSGRPVAHGGRGQVVVNHVSRSFLLPNNLDRDEATRVPGPRGQVGDSLADVAPVQVFDGEAVVEGVY